MLLSKSYHESLSDNICSNLYSQFADLAVCWIPHIFSEGAVSLFIVYLHIYIYRYTMIHLYIYIHIIDRYIIYLLYRLITKRTRLPHRLVKVCDILHLQGGDPAVRDSLQTKILWYIYYIMYIIYNYIYILNIKHIKPKWSFSAISTVSQYPHDKSKSLTSQKHAETVGCFCSRPWLCHHWSARHQRHTSSKATLCPDLHFRPRFGSAPCVLLTPSHPSCESNKEWKHGGFVSTVWHTKMAIFMGKTWENGDKSIWGFQILAQRFVRFPMALGTCAGVRKNCELGIDVLFWTMYGSTTSIHEAQHSNY